MALMYKPIAIKRSSKFGNNYWEAYSPKLKRNIYLFSDLEYDFWILVETNPLIEMFCERPLEIEIFSEGKLKKVMISMWLKWLNSKEEYVSIRYSSNLKDVNTLQIWCNKLGKNFVLKTEKEIRENKIFLDNMKTLLPYISNRLTPIETDIHMIKKFLYDHEKCSLCSLEKLLNMESSRVREAIFWLYYHGTISANFDKALVGPNLEVWLND